MGRGRHLHRVEPVLAPLVLARVGFLISRPGVIPSEAEGPAFRHRCYVAAGFSPPSGPQATVNSLLKSQMGRPGIVGRALKPGSRSDEGRSPGKAKKTPRVPEGRLRLPAIVPLLRPPMRILRNLRPKSANPSKSKCPDSPALACAPGSTW